MDTARFIYNLNNFPLDLTKARFSDPETFRDLENTKRFFKYFTDSVSNFLNGSFTDSKVELTILEIGCGHALPSLSVLKLLEDSIVGTIDTLDKMTECQEQTTDFIFNINVTVFMQDFNKQILEGITYENVKKFLEQSNKMNAFYFNNSSYKINFIKTFQFVYGDWRVLLERNLLPKNYFNLILTSETIYNSQNYKFLINVFKECLCQENVDKTSNISSVLLLSAKTYYFGCGGNLHEFLSLVKSNNYQFSSSKNLLFDAIIDCQSDMLTKSQSSINVHTHNLDKCQIKEAVFKEENKKNSSCEEEEEEAQLYVSNISKEIIKICLKN